MTKLLSENEKTSLEMCLKHKPAQRQPWRSLKETQSEAREKSSRDIRSTNYWPKESPFPKYGDDFCIKKHVIMRQLLQKGGVQCAMRTRVRIRSRNPVSMLLYRGKKTIKSFL